MYRVDTSLMKHHSYSKQEGCKAGLLSDYG